MTHPTWNAGLLHRLEGLGSIVTVPPGTELFGPGHYGEAFLIVRGGAVRVEQTSPSGRSVVLYRVGPSDSCVMTTSCMLSDIPYSAYGYAEGEVSALAIPRPAFLRLLAEDAEFRSAVFAAFSHRLVELSQVIDDLLLNRVDQKLAHWLAAHPQAMDRIRATHQQVATEMGSAREVMSRVLKEFERRGWVALERGVIRVLDRAALRRHGGSDLM